MKKHKKRVFGNQMERMVRKSLKRPFFQEVLREWALHVENAVEFKVIDATTFANLYLEMMRDSRNDEARQGCAAFATFMKAWSWKKMLAVLRGAADKDTLATFERPEAEIFYKQFKHMIIKQIRVCWEQFLKNRVKYEPVPIPQQTGTWKEQAIRAATEKIEFHNYPGEGARAYLMKPKIVCICGSTRFLDQMAIAAWEMEKKGILVVGPHLLPASYPGVKASHQAEAEGVREILDELHLRKIDLSDEVLVVNVNGYVGESTRNELAYAKRIGRAIRYMEC